MLNEKKIELIESALDIKLYDWQKNYLLKKPLILILKTTGRCQGKTLVHIIELLFKDDSILDLSNFEKVAKHCDWWSVERNERRIKGHRYPHWFRNEIKKIYFTLNDKGIRTRQIQWGEGKAVSKPFFDEYDFTKKIDIKF